MRFLMNLLVSIGLFGMTANGQNGRFQHLALAKLSGESLPRNPIIGSLAGCACAARTPIVAPPSATISSPQGRVLPLLCIVCAAVSDGGARVCLLCAVSFR